MIRRSLEWDGLHKVEHMGFMVAEELGVFPGVSCSLTEPQLSTVLMQIRCGQ